MNVRCLTSGLPARDDAPSVVAAEGETSVSSPTVGFFSSCPKTDATIAGSTERWPSHKTTAAARPKRSHEATPENQRRVAGTVDHRIIAFRSVFRFAPQLQ